MKKINNTSKYLKSVIAFDWWKYLIASLVISVLVYYAFHMKLSLKRYEQLQIFVTAEITDEKIIDDLKGHLEDKGIEEVVFITVDVDSNYFDVRLDTNGFGNGDILLLPSSKVVNNEHVVQNSHLFNDDFIDEIESSFAEAEFLMYEEYTYAVKIYDKDDANYGSSLNFKSWVSFDETYYMLFAKKSPNLGKYGVNSKEEHDAIIEAMKYLLS